MLLIIANLYQLFGADNTPRGWTRWAWVNDSGVLVVCVMLVLPEPELQLISYNPTTAVDLFTLSLHQNKRVPLMDLLRDKTAYQQARMHIFRANVTELELLCPTVKLVCKLQMQGSNVVREPLDPHFLLFFWDSHYPCFAVPSDADEWTETAVLAESNSLDSWREWKQLLSLPPYDDDSKVLFTCFEGHNITSAHFTLHTQRVNQLLQAVINDQILLCSANWIPCLTCPVDSCSQQLTPAFITRRSVLQQVPLPPVAETVYLLCLLKQKWGYTAS